MVVNESIISWKWYVAFIPSPPLMPRFSTGPLNNLAKEHSVCKNENSDMTSMDGEVLGKFREAINKVSSSTVRVISQSGGWNGIGISNSVFHHGPHFELRHCIFCP